MSKKNEVECCQKFDRKKWNEKIFNWENKRFVKGKVFTFFYMPMNFGSAITKLLGKISESKAIIDDNLCLSDHTSKWNMDIYLAVDKEVANAENAT